MYNYLCLKDKFVNLSSLEKKTADQVYLEYYWTFAQGPSSHIKKKKKPYLYDINEDIFLNDMLFYSTNSDHICLFACFLYSNHKMTTIISRARYSFRTNIDHY